MTLKKLLLSLGAALCLGSFAFADVAVKDLDGTNVEISFTFKDDAASEMNVIGSFDNWTVPGEAMTKNAAGLWEYKLKATIADEITYKFYYKGSWIFDFKAPDKKDDGFGGNNGLIVVADVLANSGKAPGAATAGGAAGARRKVYFGTVTWLESDTVFDTADSAFAPTASSVVAKSTWKFSGDLVTRMPGYFELTFFDGTSPLWEKDSVDAVDGLQGLAAGFIFNPFYYLGGARPTIDKFRFGFDTKYLSYETGYANTWLPGRSSILWDTVQAETIAAGSGYSAFRLGPSLAKIGDIALDAAFVPNKSIDDKFGLYGYASAAAAGWKGDLQYEMRSFTKTDALNMLKNIPRQDLILGGEYFLGQLSFRGQFLLSMFASGSTADDFGFTEKVAGEIALGYSDIFDAYAVTFDYKYRGSLAQSLFMNDSATLGAVGTMTVGGDGLYRVGHWVTAKMAASAVLQNEDPTGSNISIDLSPGTALDFSVPAMRPLTADLYGKVTVNTVSASDVEPFAFSAAGARLSVGKVLPGIIESVDLWYGLDNRDSTAMFNSLLAEAKFAWDLIGQLGFALRSGKSAVNPFGAAVGASWVVPIPQAKSPTVYAQFVYNMDPYDSGTRVSYDFDDDNAYLAAGGTSTSDGASALRLGIKWDF